MKKQREASLPRGRALDDNYETNVRQLKASLPREAVTDVVNEVLMRVRGLRASNGDRVNRPSRRKVEQLCYALISDDSNEGATFIRSVQEDGATLEAIYLSYLAEAAAILGEWWEDDHATFQEVAIGTSRIYAIVRNLSYLFVPDRPVEVKSAIFATVPGETHILGVRMAADLFGSEGWNVDLQTGKCHDDLVAEIVDSPSRILGLSAAGAHAAGPLARLIVALRLSRPDLYIFLSGQIVNVAPDLVKVMDLDGSAKTVEEAQEVLQRFWTQLSAQRI